MAINHVIIHEVKRDKSGDAVTKTLRDDENDVRGLAEKLTNDLIELFATSNLNIGEFGVDGDNTVVPVFEQKLLDYYGKEKPRCDDFVRFTKELSNRFYNIIDTDKLKNVKGGILVFYEYEYRNSLWLAIAILNRNEGVNVSDQLDLVPSKIIDLNKLHLGAAINLTDWSEELSSRYIKFKTGKSVEIRDYFEGFIGCQRDKQAATKETIGLREAIQAFSKTGLGLDVEDTQKKLELAMSFIKEKQKSADEILLSHIANAVFPDKSDEFLRMAQEDHDLSEQLAIDNKELRRFVRLSGRFGGVSISFDSKLLGKSVIYENDKLTFKELPDSLKNEIETELAARKEEE